MTAVEKHRSFSLTYSADYEQQRCGAAVFEARHCSSTRVAIAVIGEIEGDPFGGPVAMRLGVGGSWSTVERTRQG